MKKCPCGSGLDYSTCCQPLITGATKPVGLEQLARARHTAHFVGNILFLKTSHTPGDRQSIDWHDYLIETTSLEWLLYDLVSVHAGGKSGSVVAMITVRKQSFVYRYRETSTYLMVDGEWYFNESDIDDMKKICPCDKSHCLGCY